MSNPPEDERLVIAVAAWINKAEEDFLAAENNVNAEAVPWSAVCFHAQQAAEKYLKAALVVSGLTPPYTHDLTDLLTRVADIAPSIAALADEADLLSVYAVDVRYPDFVGIVTAEDGREALQAARKIKDGVLPLLPARLHESA